MNNTMVREIRGAKINPKSSFKKIRVRKISGGGNYASKYGTQFLSPYEYFSSHFTRVLCLLYSNIVIFFSYPDVDLIYQNLLLYQPMHNRVALKEY
jgi:hypothetical protein